MWDTYGEERFRTLSDSYYKGADIVLLMCAQGDEVNFYFDGLVGWYDEVSRHLDLDHVILAIVCTKSDLERTVTKERICNMAQHFRIPEGLAFEVSALTGSGVEEMLENVCSACLALKKIGRFYSIDQQVTATNHSKCIIVCKIKVSKHL